MSRNALLALFAALPLLLVGCPKKEAEQAGEAEKTAAQKPSQKNIELVYVEWSSEVASTNLVKAVLEQKLGYQVELTPVSAAAMWQALSTQDADAMVAAWLPTTHGRYLERVKDDVVDLGPNLKGTRIGLVVPSYVDVDSIDQLDEHAEEFDGKIIGIDPGAGIMSKTEQAIEAYGLKNMELVESSGATMTAALADAIKNKEPIVVTGWTPHWMWARWDLKYLKDPKNVYGGAEEIHTVVRKGLKEDMPEAYAFLDAFEWSPEDMAQLMVMIREEGATPAEAAKKWMSQHEDQVKSWLPEQGSAADGS